MCFKPEHQSMSLTPISSQPEPLLQAAVWHRTLFFTEAASPVSEKYTSVTNVMYYPSTADKVCVFPNLKPQRLYLLSITILMGLSRRSAAVTVASWSLGTMPL